jgi:hypothetical protein
VGFDDTLITPPSANPRGSATVEVELVHEAGRPGLTGRGWCALRLWTVNHVYDLDWSMRCIRVVGASSGEPVPGHGLLGAILTGGQSRDGETLELTYPVPRPGVSAVFEVPGKKPQYVTTSEVLRVVMRLRVMSVSEEGAEPSWQELSGSFRATQLGFGVAPEAGAESGPEGGEADPSTR